MSVSNRSELQILSWNIHGAFYNIDGDRYSKLSDAEFLGHTSKYLVFGLIETQHTADDVSLLQLPGVKCYQVCRSKLRRGRKSGGICVYVHNSISRGVSKVNTTGSESIQIKLCKEYFHFNRDIVVSFTYCVPSGSSYQSRTQFDPFDDLEEKLSSVARSNDLVCIGDYNARTALKPDYFVEDQNTNIPVVDDLFMPDSVAVYPRGNLDTGTNGYGDRLLDLCKTVPLRICNGRKLGDVAGNFTCILANGQSTVDYCMVSPSIYHRVSSFSVGEFIPTLSDHCSCSVVLNSDYLLDNNLSGNYEFITNPKKVSWNSDISNQFEMFIQTFESKSFLKDFKSRVISDQETLDSGVSALSGFLTSAAQQAAGPGPRAPRGPPVTRVHGRARPRAVRPNKPKWFSQDLKALQRQVRLTSKLLRQQPRNSYLKGKLFSESKEFRRLRKQNQRDYVAQLYDQFDQLEASNPRGYMDLVRSLRDGSFDKKVTDSTSQVSPENWRDHFKSLLGSPVQQTPAETELVDFVQLHRDGAKSELDLPFTKAELLAATNRLKNNKAISFDRVSNEMLKTSKLVIGDQLLLLFNSILESAIYPSEWRRNILTPLHKSGSLSDPGNFRGIAVASCLSKLFNKLIQKRLEDKCVKENSIKECQGSGKRGSRTSDHLVVMRFLIDKYVNLGGKKLFACFFDIRKAFDCVPRSLLFHTLLTQFNIGGNFLKVLQEMYSGNKVFVKLPEGLCQPFSTTVGLLQGEVNSPILFNLFINNISDVFDNSCDPVQISGTDQNCLLWADDLFLVSQSAEGLQRAINKVHLFYLSLGLHLNVSKTKIMVFNKSGRVLKNFHFFVDGNELEVTDCYQYLGVKVRPSGTFTFAAEELCIKAKRAWFSISSIIYKDKRMPTSRAFKLFDSLVSPVALYACEFWLPLIMPQKCFRTEGNLMSFWETLKCETLNQNCARIILSVHRKASRLAVLGDLGRYPLAIKAMAHTLDYRLCLARKPASSPVGMAMAEMADMVEQGKDCWLARVGKMSDLMSLPRTTYGKSSGRRLTYLVQRKFSLYWLDQVQASRVGPDGENHNKLQTYGSFKSHFGTEPYIELVINRNQRCHLSRLRTSAHRLGIEVLRYRRPAVPRHLRYCDYCTLDGTAPRPLDDECHALTQCTVGAEARVGLYSSMTESNREFPSLSKIDQFKLLVCPTNPTDAKLVSRYLQLIFNTRDSIDQAGRVV